jgi:cell division protein FtsB
MASDRGGVFWREVYWFVVIALIAITVALLVLPPRAVRYSSLARLESDLKTKNERLDEQQQKLESAIAAMKEDAFYKENVFRKVLGVKKNDEEVLGAPDADDQ